MSADPKTAHPLPLDGCELILIRHGQSTANAMGIGQGRAEYPLSELGKRQAAATGEYVRSWGGVAAVYASPQERAFATAQAIGTPIPVPELVEIDVGALSGLTWDQLAEVHPREVAIVRYETENAPHARVNEWIPGWERAEVVLDRTWKAIADIAARHPGERVAVVAHGGVLNAFLTHLLVGDAREVEWAYRIGNCAITRVLLAPGGVQAACVADQGHLATLS